MDFTSMCRICLLNYAIYDLKSIFTTYYGINNMPYNEMIKYCIGIIFVNDCENYPTNICTNCEESLLKIYSFKQQIIKANTQLDNVMLFSKINIIDSILTDTLQTQGLPESLTFDDCSNKNKMISESEKLTRKREQGPYCYKCEKHFKNRDELKMHKKIHLWKRPQELCPICGILTRSPQHSLAHTESTVRKMYECVTCNRRFNSQNFLRTHMRTHIDVLPFKCRYCDRKFKDYSNRRYHVKTVHTGEANFICNICNKKFVQSSHYKSHIYTHTGETPFKCDSCEKGFSNHRKLRDHITIIHKKEKNFKCSYCDKKYSLKKHLVRHEKTHKNVLINKNMSSNKSIVKI